VVEGVEGPVGCDRELEAISDPLVLDRHGEGVLIRIPEQQDVDPVALAGGEFAGLLLGSWLLLRSSCLDARSAVALRHRRKAGFELVPTDDFVSHSGRSHRAVLQHDEPSPAGP
jgi:hypothetical protein